MRNYVCELCKGSGDHCLRCGGCGWVGEALVRKERQDLLADAIAKILVQEQIAKVGEETWAKMAAEMNLTVDQYTEVEMWSATGPIKGQFMVLTGEVLDAVASLAGIETPPPIMTGQPTLKPLSSEESDVDE